MSPVALTGTERHSKAAQIPSRGSIPGARSVADALANVEFNLQ